MFVRINLANKILFSTFSKKIVNGNLILPQVLPQFYVKKRTFLGQNLKTA